MSCLLCQCHVLILCTHLKQVFAFCWHWYFRLQHTARKCIFQNLLNMVAKRQSVKMNFVLELQDTKTSTFLFLHIRKCVTISWCLTNTNTFAPASLLEWVRLPHIISNWKIGPLFFSFVDQSSQKSQIQYFQIVCC